MNIDSIPKSFWHAASFAIVTLTVGFLYISFMYGDLSIKFDKLELRTQNTIALEDSIKMQEETLKQREKEIEELRALLDKRAAELTKLKEQIANLTPTESAGLRIGSPLREEALSSIDRLALGDEFEERYREKQQTLSSLKDKQDQFQQVYQSQKAIITKQAPQK